DSQRLRERSVGAWVRETKRAPDRFLAGPETFGHGLVDDGDGRGGFDVFGTEGPAGGDGDLQGLVVVAFDRRDVDQDSALLFRRHFAFDEDRSLEAGRERKTRGDRGGLDLGKSGDALEELAVELRAALGVVTLERDVEIDGEDLIGRETRVDGGRFA